MPKIEPSNSRSVIDLPFASGSIDSALGDYRVLLVRLRASEIITPFKLESVSRHLVDVNHQPGKLLLKIFSFSPALVRVWLSCRACRADGIRPRPQREREVARQRVHAQRHHQNRHRQPVQADAACARRRHLLVARHAPEAQQHAEQHRHRKRQFEEGRHDVADDAEHLAEADAVVDHHVHQLEQFAGDQREGQQADIDRERHHHLARDIAVDDCESRNCQSHENDRHQGSAPHSSLDIPLSD